MNNGVFKKSSNTTSETDVYSGSKKSEEKSHCRKKKYHETQIISENQKSKSKSCTRIDPLAFSNNEDLVEAYPSQGIYRSSNNSKYHTIS